jgi:hypothetical protein
MDNLYNKLSRVHETVSDGAGSVMTSSGDIAYARGGMFGAVGQDNFNKPFPGLDDKWEERKKKRTKLMREAIDGKIVELQQNITTQLQGLASTSKLSYKQFMTFGNTKDLTPNNIMIGLLREDNDIEKMKTYFSQDVGELELISTALQSSQDLNKFEEFATFDYLFGCRIKSVPIKTVVLIYEGVMDMTYTEKESLTIGDPDIAGIMQERTRCKITVSGKWARVFPTNGFFDQNFYSILREVIKSDFDGVNPEGEEGDEQIDNEAE